MKLVDLDYSEKLFNYLREKNIEHTDIHPYIMTCKLRRAFWQKSLIYFCFFRLAQAVLFKSKLNDLSNLLNVSSIDSCAGIKFSGLAEFVALNVMRFVVD